MALTNSFRNKKGQIIHLMIFGIAFLVIGIAILLTIHALRNINLNIQASPNLDAPVKAQLDTEVTAMPGVFDYAFAFFIVGGSIVLILSCYMINTSPIFFFITLPVFTIILIVNAIFANILDQVGNSPEISGTYLQFPIMNFFASHWLPFTIVVGCVAILAYFGGKSPND